VGKTVGSRDWNSPIVSRFYDSGYTLNVPHDDLKHGNGVHAIGSPPVWDHAE
jgi:hypothetical protein